MCVQASQTTLTRAVWIINALCGYYLEPEGKVVTTLVHYVPYSPSKGGLTVTYSTDYASIMVTI